MPLETLEREDKKPRVYTKKSDMWSYGVTLWEVYSKGAMPFKGLKAKQVKEMLKNGERLPQPMDCPKSV